MKRRALLSTGAAAALAPSIVGAQGNRSRRVAVLISAGEADPEGKARFLGLSRGLRELGWIDGENIRLDVRYAAGDPERIRTYIAEFTAAAPDLIVINSTPALAAAYKATSTIPVVIMLAVDPVRLGFIDSLARPGRNITGFVFFEAELIGKWLQLLKEVSPSLSHATLLHNPGNTPFYPQLVKAMAGIAGLPDVTLEVETWRTIGDIEQVIANAALKPNHGLIVPSDPFNLNYRVEISAAAIKARLPLISIFPSVARAGGLMSYGPDTEDIYRRAATYVDRILKGTKPGDLPAQVPTKYDLLINTGTAAKLGLVVPPIMLARADEVIE